MHKRKLFALIIGVTVCSLSAVSYAATSSYSDSSSLVVSVPAQPASGIAPAGALHVPFTRFDLTARGTDIIVRSISVEHVGPASDDAFEDILLLDSQGEVLSEGSLDERVVAFDDTLYIPRGTTLHIAVAANMADDLIEFDGQMSRLIVTEIVASGYVPLQ